MVGMLTQLNKMLLNELFDNFLNVAFNIGMDDKERIKSLGGAAKVAQLLGYSKEKGGIQRVHNWMTRGIPYKVKVEHPDLFLSSQKNSALAIR